MKYQGIIFDFNGVLWLDNHIQHRAWNQFAQKLRGYPLTEEEMTQHIHGRNNQYGLEYICGHSLPAAEVTTLTKEKELIYQQLCRGQKDKFRLSPGAITLLDWLVDHHVPRTIATASPPGNVNFFIKHLQLAKWFDPTKIIYDDGTHPGKPAPDIYLLAAKNIGVSPQNCIVIEDAKSGIAAARAAGIGYIIALGSKPRHEILKNIDGVNQVVSSLEEINSSELF